jgi:thiosulfate dehydrogenase [quinone] large subunit
MKQNNIEFLEPPFSRFLFANTKMAWLWLIIRLYVGWQWVEAGWGKVHSNLWVGSQVGVALRGFLQSSLVKAAGAHPDVQGWYAGYIQNFVMPHAAGFGYLVAYGELLVGIALILGIFTGIAAFFGTFMNLNYLLAGAVSINPILLLLQLFLILAWRVAGWYGLDRWVLPALGTPWQKGSAFK